MMIDDLLEIQDTPDFDLCGYTELVAVEKKAASIDLNFKIFTGVDDEQIQTWKVICLEAREYKTLLGEPRGNFELLDDHVLLWAYNQPKLSLTFSHINPEIDVYQVIGKLYEKHFSLVRKWIPFDSYFNAYNYLTLEKLLSSGYGKLADGAEKIILGYQEVLDEFKIKSSYLSSTPKRWNNDRGWIDEEGDAKILMFGSSYIIASSFAARKILN